MTSNSSSSLPPFSFSGSLTFSPGIDTLSPSLSEISLSDHISTATRLLIESSFDDCLSLLSSLLPLYPSNPVLLDLHIECLISLRGINDPELQNSIMTSCKLHPNMGYSKWMYLGQMADNVKTAQKAFCKGIEIINEELNKSSVSFARRKVLSSAKTTAYVSIAELFMTPPGCDEDDAEYQCETSLQLAISNDPSSPEALCTLASLRLVQQRDEDAKSEIEKCLVGMKGLGRWSEMPIGKVVTGGGEEGEEEENNNNNNNENKSSSSMSDDSSSSSLPSPSFFSLLDTFSLRLNVSKVCVELSKYREAEKFLTELYEENDSIIEVIHLLAVVKFHRGKYTQCMEIVGRAVEKADEEINTLGRENGKENKENIKELKRLRGIMMELSRNAETKGRAEGDTKESEDEGEDEDGEGEEEEEDGEMEDDQELKKQIEDIMVQNDGEDDEDDDVEDDDDDEEDEDGEGGNVNGHEDDDGDHQMGDDRNE